MPRVQSFPPVVGTNPKILILGSMPGVASLEAQQYYAHPRNAFWPIMGDLLAVEWVDDYGQRITQLKKYPIALWDVLYCCRREGSLDASIDKQRYEPNDIPALLTNCPDIKMIGFNGAAAHKFFRQSFKGFSSSFSQIEQVKLPSTSPAHASKSLQQKLNDWSILKPCLQED